MLLRSRQSILDTVPVNKMGDKKTVTPLPTPIVGASNNHTNNGNNNIGNESSSTALNNRNSNIFKNANLIQTIHTASSRNNEEMDLFRTDHQCYSLVSSEHGVPLGRYNGEDLGAYSVLDENDEHQGGDYEEGKHRRGSGVNNRGGDAEDGDDGLDEVDGVFRRGFLPLGDTITIQRTVGLLNAHKLSISEMVEVRSRRYLRLFTAISGCKSCFISLPILLLPSLPLSRSEIGDE